MRTASVLLSSREFLAEAAHAEVSYRQLDYWVRCGSIRPEQEAAGSGTRRLWSRADIPRLRRVARFVAFMDFLAGTGTSTASTLLVRSLWESDPTVELVLDVHGATLVLPAEDVTPVP